MAGDDGTGGVAAEGVGVRVMPLNMSNACVAGDADPTDAADAADAARPGTGGGTDAVGTPPSEDAMNENPLPALAAEATETPRPCKVGVARGVAGADEGVTGAAAGVDGVIMKANPLSAASGHAATSHTPAVRCLEPQRC